MGIPKFYRYMSERYPALSKTVKENEVPEFDNLYLDMNGIIHNCSHANNDNPNLVITEDKIFSDVTKYIENLFSIIKPQQLFYMAVDGCAPRAKMNQQRARRFRSAEEAEEALQAGIKKGEVTQEQIEGRFDSNCITPGTPFMTRLQAHLEHFVHLKLTTDPSWTNIKVVLDGHQCPGEGEHKIMDYIRFLKAQPGYNINTRHCMYGLDADLMILGLLSHEPYFFLLREEVLFNRKRGKKEATAESKTWHLLSLTLFRGYIKLEFSDIEDKLGFAYDFERLLDDWVLLGFFVGNDFLPHLPNFHIGEDIKPWIYKCYMNVIVKLDGWLTDGGIIDMGRLQILFNEFAVFDKEHFNDKYADLKWFAGKTGNKKDKKNAAPNTTTTTTATPTNITVDSTHNHVDTDNVFQNDDEDDDADIENQHSSLFGFTGFAAPQSTAMFSASCAQVHLFLEGKTFWGARCRVGLFILIVFNGIAVVVESVDDVFDAAPSFWRTFEIISVALFTIEYILRVFSATHDKRIEFSRAVYTTSFFGVVDLLGILPFYVQEIVQAVNGDSDESAAAVFRVLRLFRLFHLENFMEAFSLLDDVYRECREILHGTGVVALVIWVGGAVLFQVSNADKIENVPVSLYYTAVFLGGEWALCDFSVVGKVLCMFYCAFGIALYGTCIGFLGDAFTQVLEAKAIKAASAVKSENTK
eukprot:m.210246 g.210246  ORF g.210246 m.210246 type:complete len:696 (-) comp33068_c2_seq2:238-2325(-)